VGVITSYSQQALTPQRSIGCHKLRESIQACFQSLGFFLKQQSQLQKVHEPVIAKELGSLTHHLSLVLLYQQEILH
ncbi:hypothetical protein, partial [Cronobacter sakazakii]|uniref:hypothetical protein n=1 Tax=Cronobacter sakazakii TaxID=28141 RepID=UPI00195E122D